VDLVPGSEGKFLDVPEILGLLREVTAAGGNLLLNVGPSPQGAVVWKPEQERLETVGRWLDRHGEAVYGRVDRVEALAGITNTVGGQWTRRGNTAYLWLPKWPGDAPLALENAHTKLLACSILSNGQKLEFEQTPPDAANKLATKITIRGMPKDCPDPVCGYAVLKLTFEAYPQ